MCLIRCLPLILFIPNLNLLGINTSFGSIEIIDLLIVPAILLLMIIDIKNSRRTVMFGVSKYITAFTIWLLFTIIIAYIRFDYFNDSFLQISVLKIANFFSYCVFAFLYYRNIPKSNVHQLMKVFTLTALLISSSVILVELKILLLTSDQYIYSNQNVTSVALSILSILVLPILMKNRTSIRKQLLGFAFIGFVSSALFLSGGRAGAFGFIIGVLFYFIRHFTIQRKILSLGLGLLLLFIAYNEIDDVKYEIDRTIFPSENQYRKLRSYDAGMFGIDDGKRLYGLTNNIKKVDNFPIAGAGYLNRTEETQLHYSGSHNYFLQIWLETGFIGLTILLLIIYKVTKIVRTIRYKPIKIGVQLSLIVALLTGFTGEYFYSGEALMTLLLAIGIAIKQKNQFILTSY